MRHTYRPGKLGYARLDVNRRQMQMKPVPLKCYRLRVFPVGSLSHVYARIPVYEPSVLE